MDDQTESIFDGVNEQLADKLIHKFLEALPAEGLDELQKMIDTGDCSEAKIVDLCQRYNIDIASVVGQSNKGGDK